MNYNGRMRGKRIGKRPHRLLHLLWITVLSGYLICGLTPGSLKYKVIEPLNIATGFNIYYDRVYFLPPIGLYVRGVHIRDADGATLLKAGHIWLTPDWMELFKTNLPVAADVNAWGVEVNYWEKDDPAGTKSPTGEALQQPVKVLSSFSSIDRVPLTPGRVFLRNSHLIIRDKENGILEQLYLKEFKTDLSDMDKIPFTGDIRIPLTGRFSTRGFLEGKDYRVICEGEIKDTPRFVSLANKKVSSLIKTVRGKFKLTFLKTADKLNFDLMSSSGHAELRHEASRITSDFEATAKGVYENNQWSVSEGTLRIKNAEADSLSYGVGNLNYFSADVKFDPQTIYFSRIRGIWDGSAVMLDGSIKRGAPYETELTLRQKTNSLTPWRKRFPQYFTSPLAVNTLTGNLIVTASVKGPLKDLSKHIKEVRLDISQGQLNPTILKKPLSNINAVVRLKERGIYLDEASFGYKKENYRAKAEIIRNGSETSRFTLTHQDADVSALFKVASGSLLLEEVTAKTDKSQAVFKGVIDNLKTLDVLLDGNFTADIKDVWRRWSPLKDSKLNLAGGIEGNFTLKGPLTEFNKINCRISTVSKGIHINNWFSRRAESDWQLEDGNLNLTYSKLNLYGGELRADGKLNLSLPNQLFKLHLFVQDVDLYRLIEPLQIEGDVPEGIFHIDLNISGHLNNKASWYGQGNFHAIGGSLWTTDKFHELSDLSFVHIDGMDRLTFNRADGSFSIGNGKLNSEDWTLHSRHIDVHMRGGMSLEGDLDFKLISRFTSELRREGESLGGFAPAIMGIAENKITQYQLTGTYKKPVFEAALPDTIKY